MSDTASDNAKYKWTPESTALLVSVWSDRQVQKQLEYAPRPQVIWENVARYMHKKGYNVGAKHCRSRMKQVLVCYKEAKQAGTRSSLEQYYEIIDRVMKNKRLEQINVNGIDTVDATANIKSPPKDMKTNKNLQMRLKVQRPVQSLYRTDALSPTWIEYENEYPDSPESNETIIARPHRVFSPTREVVINTNKPHLIQTGNQVIQTNSVAIEKPIQNDYRQNLLAHYPYGEIPYQNTVQNVQNQIIQENMQQNVQQNRTWNQLPRQNVPTNEYFGLQQNVLNHVNRRLPSSVMQGNMMLIQNPNAESIIRQQNQLQQNALYMDNRAMPQEPRKTSFGQNLQTDRMCKQSKDMVPHLICVTDVNTKNTDSMSPDYSPDVSQNLNDAFCLSKSNEKAHNLNETYSQPDHLIDNPILESNVTVMTNNATCNDDTLLLEYLLDSPTPSENIGKSRDSAVNTDNVPNAPFRKKKAQKLEQLVLSAINSQNEVVNKILAAQNDMVTRFLDVDRDRQNRLEIRLDHLLNVVHATVHKNAETEHETSPSRSSSPPPKPTITSLHPPPKPGMVPPKLDLVPPKPCRVPCTMPSSNIELINHNPISTRPGVVSPITSPDRKPGTIWSKLGPVSQSPFMKAQQRLGLQTIAINNDARMQSSAERRIAKQLSSRPNMNTRSLIYETVKLLEVERQLEEKIENARLEKTMGQTLTARRKLFTQREPTPIMILTAAFLDAECCIYKINPPYHGTWNSYKEKLKYAQRDNFLAGQGESYERMHHLNTVRRDYLDCEPCTSSTPAKLSYNPNNNAGEIATHTGVPKQTIQQLARLVMNSARWRDPNQRIQQLNSVGPTIASTQLIKQNTPDIEYNATFTAPKANAPPLASEKKPQAFVRSSEVMQQKQSNHDEIMLSGDLQSQTKFPMGFTTDMLIVNEQEGAAMPKQTDNCETRSKSLGFVNNPQIDCKNNVRFLDDALAELQRMCIERQAAVEGASEMLSFAIKNNCGNNGTISAHSRNMIEQYVSDLMMPKKQIHDKDIDSDNDDEFLDTTTSMHPTCVISRRSSLMSNETASTETARSLKFNKTASNNCRIS